MMIFKNGLGAFYFSLVLLICEVSVAAQDANQLPEPIRQIMKKYNLPMDSLSLHIQQDNAPVPLLAINIDTPRHPASVIKLLVTYAGLALLGSDYQWNTSIYLDGVLRNGTLNGDLIIKGGGDPFLSHERFRQLLATLRNRGLQHIHGDLLIDASLFEQETGGRSDFDNRPYRAYNVFPNAALLNFNVYQFHFIPLPRRVHIYTDPLSANLTINNRLRLVSGRCQDRYRKIRFKVSAKGDVVTFRGDYPKRCGEQSLLRVISSNEAYVFGVFKALWEEMGGTISGQVQHTTTTIKQPFYQLPSKPLSEIINNINKHSNNVMARQLLLTIGLEKLNTVGSKDSGNKAIVDWLHDINIAAPELVLDNGSGLSRKTRISAQTISMLLQHALASPYQPEFFASLPLLGVDGTLKKRLKDKIPAGNVRIKTGVINNVRAMAGYVRSKSNKNYTVVALQNHQGIHHKIGTVVQDQILQWLYEQ